MFSLLDAAMAQISLELPFINQLTLQTDGAKSYNNNFYYTMWNILPGCNAQEQKTLCCGIHPH